MMAQTNLFTGFVCTRKPYASAASVSVEIENGALKVITPYSADFLGRLKTEIPATARKWDGESKCWLVSSAYGLILKNIIDSVYLCDVLIPLFDNAKSEVFETTVTVDYVSNCKGEASSIWCNGGWNAKVSEKVLREYFGQAAENDGTFYGVLGIERTAGIDEIKRGYKKMARLYHPDLCREENAREMFEQIKQAYDILSDIEKRNKYNAGLFFETLARTGKDSVGKSRATFAPPIRCGKLTVKAKKELGVLIIEEILDWQEIKNQFGQTMVTFWDKTDYAAIWV